MTRKRYKYTAFVSYAFGDDKGNAGWIRNFDRELNVVLKGQLGAECPTTFLAGRDGPSHGVLSERLETFVNDSFAMIIFVHDRYLHSAWCLKEIAHFQMVQGVEGFRDRLFIIAMSEVAITELSKTPDWHALMPSNHQVWMPFYQTEKVKRPIWMYLKSAANDAVMTTDFLEPFFDLRDGLVEAIKAGLRFDPDLFRFGDDEEQHVPQPNLLPYAAVAEALKTVDVLIYIESDPEDQRFWEQLGLRVSHTWDQVVGGMVLPQEPKLLLRPTGLAMGELHEDRPRLANADGVILLWGEKTEESLVAQIALVEPRLSSALDRAPGMVAYLLEPGDDGADGVPKHMKRWPVVRFRTRAGDSGAVEVVNEDSGVLDGFLLSVLQLKLRAHGAARPA
jgi:hypothetical protein